MITLTVNEVQYPLVQVQVLQNRQFIIPNFNWGERKQIIGNLQLYCKGEAIRENTKILYCNKLDNSVFYQLDGTDIEYIITNSKEPVEFFSDKIPPTILNIKDNILNANVGSIATLEFHLGSYYAIEMERIKIIYWSQLNINELKNRLLFDIDKLQKLYNLEFNDSLGVYYGQNLEDLHTLTGMNSSFSYRNKYMGLTYKAGNYRPEIHEFTHILLYNLGNPPFLFVEGLATLSNDLLHMKDKVRRYTSNMLSKKFIRENRFTTIKELFVSTYNYSNYDIVMYYIAASFMSFLYWEWGVEKLKECYGQVSRNNSLEKNLQIFKEIMGMSLEEIESRWLKALLK